MYTEDGTSDYNEQTLMEAVTKRVAATPDPRLLQIMTSLVNHLHGSVPEVRPTWEELLAGLQRACLALVLLFVSLTSIRPAAAEDAPPPPPAPPIERLFAPAREAMKDLPPFFRDTELKLHWRSYYFNRKNPEDGSENEAWAFGGWLS